MRTQIIEFVRDSEEYPTMQELIDHYFHLDGEEFADTFMAVLRLLEEGKIFYDEKHDSWLYTGGPIKGEFVKLS